MKWRTLIFTGLVSCSTLAAQDQEAPPEVAPEPVERASTTRSRTAPGWQERAKQLREMLEGAVLEGRWRLVEDGELKEEHQERYRIVELRGAGDNWLIRAEMEMNGKTVTLPVPVIVEWLGDSPVIRLRPNSPVRQLKGYNARVVFTDKSYAGTWSSADRSGVLHGTIQKE